jgi:aminomethyltransferase
MSSPDTLQQTPLYADHVNLKAKMVSFGGWSMPVQYTGILEEYAQCRKAAALFDICHMGEFIVEGDRALELLQKLFTANLEQLAINRCRYGLMLNSQGGVIDDLIIFRLAEKKFFIVVNAANIEKDFLHLQQAIGPRARCENISKETGKLDLQGPCAREALARFCPEITKLHYFQSDTFSLLGEPCLISRTGYTGELGYEIFYPWSKIKILWQKILEDDKVKPAGLGARDVLRIEMAYSLYGHEIAEEISPLEAGLEPFINFDKDFIGKDALLKQKENGLKKRIVYFASTDRRSPRQGQRLFSLDQNAIGEVTSGTFSPALQKGIGIGRICSNADLSSGTILFGSGQNLVTGQLCPKPFYKEGTLKN